MTGNDQMEVKGMDQQYVPAKALWTVSFVLLSYVVGLKSDYWQNKEMGGAKIINLKSIDKAIYEKV